MCGIVGYIGNKKAQPILLGGLRRLEYRGYDSAGIVTVSKAGNATLTRALGKVEELNKNLGTEESTDNVGIGHTRWATHGVPSERNAHPHKADGLYVVHNGIIENYQDIKTTLQDKGYTFDSETDTEVLAKLIESYYKEGAKTLLDAVRSALHTVVGAYGIAVVSVEDPNTVVVARKGSPLVLGVGDDEVFIASDAAALIGHTQKAIYLNDGEIAVCTKEGVELSTLDATPITPEIEALEASMDVIQKKGFDHFLLKEITEQPDTLRSTLAGRVHDDGHASLGGINMTAEELRNIENIIIVGCGTAFYAGLYASYMIENISNDVSVQVEIASELRYRSFKPRKNCVALIVSQSGETADTLACLRELKERGVRCLGIVNAVGSTIAREVQGGVYVHVGPEISVASTKAFTSQAAALILFGLVVAQAKGESPQTLNSYVEELKKLPEEIERVIAEHGEVVKDLAVGFAEKEHALFLGRDTTYPIALEGALKLKEISYIQAEGYAAGELKHGPIALIDDRFFEVFMLQDNWLYEKGVSNLSEVNARGGHVLAITDSEKSIDAQAVVRINTELKLLTPLLFNVILQIFAYHIAVSRGNDVDQPRNLAKSVTVE